MNPENPFLDAFAIDRDRIHWKSISRAEAILACRTGRVAVVSGVQSRYAAAWFDAENRYFNANGPYLYDSLRYFLFNGSGFASGRLKGAGFSDKAPDAELEALEFEAASGEMISMGSPVAKAPKKPALSGPAAPALPGSSAIPKPPDAPGIGAPAIPSLPEIPAISGLADLTKLPDLPGIEIPGLPAAPAIPVVAGAAIPTLALAPEIPSVPALVPELAADKKTFPIEFRLLNGRGEPFPPTEFRVTLPDGSVREGKSGADGFIRIPDNPQAGDASLQLIHSGSFPQTEAAVAGRS